MKLLPLGRDGNQGIAIVSNADFARVKKHTWYFYRYRVNEYSYPRAKIKENGKYKQVRLHEFLLKPKKGYVTDHKNHILCDNRRSNLRRVTKSQSQWNRIPNRKNHSCRYKGVSWHKLKKKWIVQIGYKRKKFWLGEFVNVLDAARQYNKWAIKLHGKYAYVNKIER